MTPYSFLSRAFLHEGGGSLTNTQLLGVHPLIKMFVFSFSTPSGLIGLICEHGTSCVGSRNTSFSDKYNMNRSLSFMLDTSAWRESAMLGNEASGCVNCDWLKYFSATDRLFSI